MLVGNVLRYLAAGGDDSKDDKDDKEDKPSM